MDRAQLLQHFDTLAEAPEAVGKLRKLVLELAVQGRLVSQQREDEDAVALLKKIDGERARRVAAKELEASPRMKTVELPITKLPSGWVWAPFGRVSFCRDGERVPVNSDERESLAKTYDYYGASGVIDKIDHYLFDKPLLLIGEDGANLVNRSTPIAFIAEGKYWVNNHAHVLDAIHRTLLEYLRIYINSINLEPYLTGMAQPKMNQAQMNSIPVSLPPLAEQRRIVAKVEELLSLCDELETRQTAAREQRTRLVRSALDHLTTAKDEADFKTHSAFCIQHSALLFDSVPTLRQAILSLAVQGRLAQQSSHDGLSTEILKRIEKERLISAEENGFRMPPASEAKEVPFPLPESWQWARLRTLCCAVTDGDHIPPPKSEDGIAFLTIGNITTGKLEFEGYRFVPRSYYAALASFRRPSRGDILSTVVGATYGRPALVETERPFCVQRHIAILKPAASMDVRFLMSALKSPLIYEQATTGTTGTAQPTIPLGALRNFLIPVPPLAEQQRIVAKVHELMRWCDALEARLTAAQTTASHLLDAVLRSILARGLLAGGLSFDFPVHRDNER